MRAAQKGVRERQWGQQGRREEGRVGQGITAMTGSHDLPFTIFIYS